ncbi:hypothetical protein BCR33DRAFT_842607 [Rhizoclosmatium globosum]|uniref:Uncharacterized protein n=1 Tax=Rhizoclosmatium globosum TaxID=329046 RepID=A0A1Y2B324_9FUNG|nr:hypothetical protein BCR33DRAFT_842607 [Rhizoclosmatium globosum]|eukprot:ORY29221.1 hypothetical protein BCR33DRAFT_842607 [Rhizoclosmatium globosum]
MSRGRAVSNSTSCSCSKTHTRLALLVNHLLAVKCKAKCPVKGCKHTLFAENPRDILEHLLRVHKKVAETNSETLNTLLSLIINPELNAVINLPKNVSDNERESGRQLLKKALSERYHLNDTLNFQHEEQHQVLPKARIMGTNNVDILDRIMSSFTGIQTLNELPNELFSFYHNPFPGSGQPIMNWNSASLMGSPSEWNSFNTSPGLSYGSSEGDGFPHGGHFDLGMFVDGQK